MQSQNLQTDKIDPDVFMKFDGSTMLLACGYHVT